MSINAAELKKLIAAELAVVRDARIVAHIRGLLVKPNITMRGWDYGSPGQEYPCWVVLDDGVYAIAYCEQGFGPRCPWGLLFTGVEAGRPEWSMGMDGSWYPTFLEAFFESMPATSLPIWKVFKIDADIAAPITNELAWDEAWKRCEELRDVDADSHYDVRQQLHP